MDQNNNSPATPPILTELQTAGAATAPAPVAPPSETSAPIAAVDQGSYQQLSTSGPNFEVQAAYSSGEIAFDPNLPVLHFPSASREASLESIKNAPNMPVAPGRKLDDYVNVVQEGLNKIPMGDDRDELRGRQVAKFEQEVEVNGEKLYGYVPKFKHKDHAKYSGESARNLVRSSLGMGTVFTAPLWHSGFWVTLRTPTEGDLLELHRQLAQDNVALGRSTYGILFSQMTGYTTKTMLDFILAHLHSSSLAVAEDDSIINYIKAADYDILVWALACATWPSGFQYQRACISDVEKCRYVVTERLNLSRLLWTDTSSLTDLQRQHMSKRQRNSMTIEDVRQYGEQFLRGKNATVDIAGKLQMTLKMPRLVDYIETSYRWVSTLEEQYGRALGMKEDERNTYLINHAQAQSMRQFSHFVHAIKLDDDEIDDDVSTIEDVLSDLSSYDDIRNDFNEKIRKFQNEAIISFIAIPNYKCPACGAMQNPTAIPGQKYELIALDVSQSFFPLLMQKLAMIRQR
jgi:hypothetical protein